MKIAMIGAGSIGFTRKLMYDILAVPEFADTHFALMDISQRNLDMVTQLVKRDIAANGLPATITATTNRREAIEGADYIICMIRQGGLEAFQLDIDIPLKYGVDQCVGDTLCAGGIMYGQRTIPAMLEICQDIREVAQPDALFLNYSNPMAMNVWACNKYGGVNTVGLCHGVQGGHWQITRCIELWAKKEGLLAEDETLHRRDVDIVCAGINHQTWYIKVQWRGMDMIPRMLELFEAHPEYSRTEKVRIDILRRFGYYTTESNGHVSEYVPWYRKRPEEIPQWIDLSRWIHGETGGYLRVCTEGRNWFETDFPNWLKEEPPTIGPERRSEEHGSYIIEALETGRLYRGHFNVINRGHITNLPDGCVVEIPGYVDRNGINMPVVGDLPLACAATCAASVRVQEMAVEAAVHGDVMLLKQAMLHDPLVSAVCNPEEVWQMVDEMLVAQARWLPQYRDEIPRAAERLAQAERNGTRVKLREGWQGAARLHTKTVEEMARDKAAARANAAAADKGQMTQEPA
ncbi:alpha-glucosidase/alpha-galactosidase [Litorilinea aerophila]|uniref:Alpha-glucosidase/alpha-galactosidase n=1 Tax=Litorilinea aerophila TaxID=1204385 RepID=A0A540VM95_9CHLR|nr:alpha-glucosidase/alpha-galactosidase [Litorilinea aerophila]MCC9074577.1 alpha-glucosidase/alpha-galactosidase [Litorilinea aerophila]OUC06364.1 alpha-galactosidase [Litorilinea aerophila]